MSTQETRLSAGVIMVHGQGAGRRYLILRAYRNWDFPKGLVEPGEQALQAAIREVAEETNITTLDFHWGYDYRETLPYRQKKIARYYVASTPTTRVHLPVSPELGKPEHDEFRWVSYEEALPLLPDRLRPILAWAHEHSQGA